MPKKKNVLIIGGGKTGSYLAGLLLKSGCDVQVIENRPPIFQRLAKELPPNVALFGDGTDPGMLERVGISKVDVLAAVTGDDEANLVVASLAKFEYQVERVIVRVNNPRNAWLCTPDMGVDTALNQSDLMATMIVEEMGLSDLQTLVRLRQGAVEIVEEKIGPDSRAANKSVAGLGLPPGCNIVAVIRGTEVIVPNGSTVLQPEDEIFVMVHIATRTALADALA
ncbi:MAG TPA: NAD-binding protein [Aggregatilineales bacterium]|nr:NAD-binding protein [Aggregatilineales bacterium]